MKAELEVLPDLPAVLAQGLFENPARHAKVMRFSTIPGDLLPIAVHWPVAETRQANWMRIVPLVT